MIQLRMSVFHETWRADMSDVLTETPGHHVIWVQSGAIKLGGRIVGATEGFYIDSNQHEMHAPRVYVSRYANLHSNNFTPCVTEAARIVRFTIEQDTGTAPVSPCGELLLSSPLSVEKSKGVLRLDRVTFPAGVTAYRHTHAGAGIRYLTRGSLQVIADDHSKTMEAGQAWFEDAYSPVKAVAAQEGVTEFIRVMVLPGEFAGKPTIKLLNSEDEAKPKLQTNYRYFDQPLNFSG